MLEHTNRLRKVPLFLGAGASATFGMPTTKEFLESMQKNLDDPCHKNIVRTFTIDKHFKDVEYVLQALRDIVRFAKSDGGRFTSSVLTSSDLARVCREFKGSDPYSVFADLEKKIEDLVLRAYSWNFDHNEDLRSIYEPIFSILETATDEITVFTTNYDDVVENYCKAAKHYSCVDGFVMDNDIPKWNEKNYYEVDVKYQVYLYKLHGSLTWKEHKKYGIIKSPYESHRGAPNITRDIVIMPTRSPKEEEKRYPFNRLFQMFEEKLETAKGCIVVGYSFRDKRINEVLLNFIEKMRIMVVISPTAVEDVKNNLFEKISTTVNQNVDETYVTRVGKYGHVICYAKKFDRQNAEQFIRRGLDYIEHTDQIINV